MSEPQSDSKKSLWEVAGTRIGVISGAIGLLVVVVGLPHTIASALGQSESKTSPIELEQQRAAVAAAGPRLEVSYLFLATDLLGTDAAGSMKANEAATLNSFPTVENEIGREDPYERQGCALGDTVEHSLAFLVIRNRGRRDADQIAVRIDRLRLSRPVRIRELAGGGDNYVAKLRGVAAATSSIVVKIPTTLGSGDGVRVPLFWSVARYGRHDRWCVNSAKAYLPLSLEFADPIVGSTTSQAVRRMADPVVLANGAYGRG